MSKTKNRSLGSGFFCSANRKSVAEIGELEGLTQLATANQRHHLLQIITLLAGYPNLVTLNGGLHLDLGILDQLDQFLGHVAFDPLLELHFLEIATPRMFRLSEIQTAAIDIALEHLVAQDVNHLLELEIGIGSQLDHLFIQFE